MTQAEFNAVISKLNDIANEISDKLAALPDQDSAGYDTAVESVRGEAGCVGDLRRTIAKIANAEVVAD